MSVTSLASPPLSPLSASPFIDQIPHDAIEEGEILGKGSYGLVIRARLRHAHFHGDEVAIKIFQTELERAAFLVELRQLSRVKHPNIINLLGASTQPPNVYLVMEYAECGSLYKVLHQVKPLIQYHSGHALSWVLQCAIGVQYLHNLKPKPLIHRDLKSPNLLLVNRGLTLKICDFGTACDKQTIMTNNKGSAAWMAPEVFEGNTYTEKCDIFSWGIILWEVLTRRLPFDEIGGNDLRVLWAVHNGKRPPPILDCPDLLEDLMERCWDKDTSVRPTIDTVVEEITFVQEFFPSANSDPLTFPDDIQDDDDTLPSASFGSAVTSLKSKSEVWRRQNSPHPQRPSPNKNNNNNNNNNNSNNNNNNNSNNNPVIPALTLPSTDEFPESFAPPNPKARSSDPVFTINNHHHQSKHLAEHDPDDPSIGFEAQPKPKGYWTPPEEAADLDIPSLPAIDPKAFANAPLELTRTSTFHQATKYAWTEDDSGPIPSDIEVVRGGSSSLMHLDQSNPIPHSPSGHFYNHHNSGAMFTAEGMAPEMIGIDTMAPFPGTHSHRYPLSDYRPMVSSLSSPQLSMLRTRSFGPGPLQQSISQPADILSDPASLSHLHPSMHPGSIAGSSMPEEQLSQRTASPQNRSPQTHRRPDLMWNRPSWINPIGTVYHGPPSVDDDWRWQQRASKHPTPLEGCESASNRSYMAGSVNSHYAGDGGVVPMYMSPVPPPIYSNASNTAYPYGQYLTPDHPYDHSYTLRRRNGDKMTKGLRPNSADANKLFSVQEDLGGSMGSVSARGFPPPHSETFKKGHRRSSSYGSGSDKYYSQLGPPNPSQNLADPLSQMRRSFSNLGVNGEQVMGEPSNGSQYYQEYLYGRDMFLDRAVEHLDPDLRPVAPQPNCPQSMKIYNDHRWLAARFVDVEQEIVDLQGYKAQLEERLAADTSNLPPDHGADNPDDSIPPEDVQKLMQLRSEKDALLQFQDKLSTQLQLIKRARQKSKDPSTSSSSMLLSSPPPVSSPLDSSNNHAFSCGKSKPTGGVGGSGPDDSWVFLNDHKK
ncbi:serine/threonine-protein kinase phg2-like [Tigriopus californicus]|uniref:serine/threonine-protein kinase phg2-like n=1 Tax=Tigriopus californicus TaxID=6832 RepID=UPI0027D9F35B|nr:serine/threonine-protein kinase phg2-like [Tigriopus californicus]|eukprot:TCALIF_02676-PA protein Name:"Similar to Map3k7 Mitogen-activated protein kinase kinase kinase 7 (Mus musculus)" AED:0.16 eAED:0.16 QI:76/1/1/1/1/1/8/238/1040